MTKPHDNHRFKTNTLKETEMSIQLSDRLTAVKTKMKDIVFEFKKKYYLAALVQDKFDVSKTARRLGAARGDIYNHVGRGKLNIINLAKFYDLL